MLKWFVYFLILLEAFAQNQGKKGFYNENAKPKKLQNLYPKKKIEQ